jgi:hypothetical protein
MTNPPKEIDLDTIDFSNLSSLLAREPQRVLQDLDGDKIEDLLLLDSGKLTIYGGTSTGMDLSKPRQILQSSGNVIGAFAAVTQEEDKNRSTKEAISAPGKENIDETKPKDLIIMRLQDISIRDVITWVYVSRNIDLDFFIYKKQGKLFEKRPAGKATLTMKLPSGLKLMAGKATLTMKLPSGLKLMKYVKNLVNPEKNPACVRIVRATLSKIQPGKGRLVLRDNTIEGFQIEDDSDEIGLEQLNENLFDEPAKLFESLGFRVEENGHSIVDYDEILGNSSELADLKLLPVRDRQPVFSMDVAPYIGSTDNEKPAGEQSIAAVDLNGDHLDDIFLFTDRGDTSVSGTLFLSR